MEMMKVQVAWQLEEEYRSGVCSNDENPGDLLHVLGELSLTGEGGNDDEDDDGDDDDDGEQDGGALGPGGGRGNEKKWLCINNNNFIRNEWPDSTKRFFRIPKLHCSAFLALENTANPATGSQLHQINNFANISGWKVIYLVQLRACCRKGGVFKCKILQNLLFDCTVSAKDVPNTAEAERNREQQGQSRLVCCYFKCHALTIISPPLPPPPPLLPDDCESV